MLSNIINKILNRYDENDIETQTVEMPEYDDEEISEEDLIEIEEDK